MIVAIAALGAALVVAYTKSETFRDIVKAALNAVKAAARALAGAFTALLGAAQTAFNWIIAHWKLGLFAFGPIGAALYILVDNFGDIKRAAKSAFAAIVSAIGDVISRDPKRDFLGREFALEDRLDPRSAYRPQPVFEDGAGACGRRRLEPRATPTRGGTTINVYGAIDPEATARSILRVLGDRERRMGTATSRRGF